MIKKVSVFSAFVTLSLIFFYFFSRLYHLTQLPVFCDEAIYVRWAQLIRKIPSLRFVPLTDGKQPLFMWLNALTLGIFRDPLFAGRFVSVLAGFGAMLALGGVSFLIFRDQTLVFLTMLVYIISPFNLFFERMALVDALLSAFIIWSFLAAIRLGRKGKVRSALLLGTSLGLGWLTKTPAMLFLPLAALVVFLIAWKDKKEKFSYLKLFFLTASALFLAFAIYNLLRLDRQSFHMIALRNKDYVWPLSEIAKHPLDPLLPHLRDVFRYYRGYLTTPLLLWGGVGFLAMIFSKKTRFWSLIFGGWIVFPLVIQSAVAKVFTARYILFSTPLFILTVAYGLKFVFKKIKSFISEPIVAQGLAVLIMILTLSSGLRFDWQLWQNPAQAPLPRDEYAGYLEEWTAGWGIREISDYIKDIAKKHRVVVSTEGFFGTLPNGLQIYVEGVKNITVIGYTVPVREISKSLKEAKKVGDKTYLVVNQSRFEIKDKKDLKLIRSYPKPGGDKLLFFELK